MRTILALSLILATACSDQEPPVIEFNPQIIVEVPEQEPPTVNVETPEADTDTGDIAECPDPYNRGWATAHARPVIRFGGGWTAATQFPNDPNAPGQVTIEGELATAGTTCDEGYLLTGAWVRLFSDYDVSDYEAIGTPYISMVWEDGVNTHVYEVSNGLYDVGMCWNEGSITDTFTGIQCKSTAAPRHDMEVYPGLPLEFELYISGVPDLPDYESWQVEVILSYLDLATSDEVIEDFSVIGMARIMAIPHN